MFKRFLTLLLPLTALLAGCQSQALPGAVGAPPSSFSVRTTAPAAAPKVLSEAQVRRLMQVAGTASLWGATYSQSYQEGTRQPVRGDYVYEHYRNFTGNAAFSGKSELLRLAYNRYVYRVPADQVLVLNTVEGRGTLYVNGYGISAGQPRSVHYLFGPGELVVFNFTPTLSGTSGWDGRQVYQRSYSYYPLAVSGFTVSPSLLGGTGALGGAK